MIPKDCGIVAGVRNQKDDPVDPTISPLGLEAALQALDVMKPSLGIDPDGDPPSEQDIPGT